MKPFKEYNPSDWKRLRPLIHGAKTVRYKAINASYMRRPSASANIEYLTNLIRGKNVIFAIAFQDLEALSWQAMLVRRHVRDAVYVIADNSIDVKMSESIAAFAHSSSTPYLRLPPNPWAQSSRSHGIALNWIWHNLILPAQPKAFGFVDDDIFPTQDDDPFSALEKQDCFGVVRGTGRRWFLWAGYCFYKFEAVKSKKLDFSQDWFNGLDTGGGNWRTIYRFIDRNEMLVCPSKSVPFKPGISIEDGPLQWCGSWLHEVGQMGRKDLVQEKRQAVAKILNV